MQMKDMAETKNETTKEQFLFKALKLFSERGYGSVTVAQIASEVGCTAPALYKHYKGKRELFSAIIERSMQEFDKGMERIQVNFEATPELKEKYINITEDGLVDITRKLMLHPLHDEWATAFRKLMIVEQFHMRELADIYNERYVYAQYKRYAELFNMLMDSGRMKEADPFSMAVAFVSPVIVLIGVCDRDKGKEEWAIKTIEQHVRDFYSERMIKLPGEA